MASKTRQPPNKTRRPDQTPRLTMTQRVMSWPRYIRMLVVFVGVLVLAFSLQQVMGELYLRAFSETFTLSTISWIVAAICLSMYMAGYVFVIGMPGSTPPAGRAQTIYLTVILVLGAVSSIWMIVRAAGALAE